MINGNVVSKWNLNTSLTILKKYDIQTYQRFEDGKGIEILFRNRSNIKLILYKKDKLLESRY